MGARHIAIGQPSDPADANAVRAAAASLPDDYVVYSDVALPVGQTGQIDEHDLVVVAPHAVFTVEFKDWGGTIIADRSGWTLGDGRFVPSPTPVVMAKARVLKQYLLAARGELAGIQVRGLVLLVAADAHLRIASDIRSLVCTLRDFSEALADTAAFQPGRPLSSSQVSALHGLLRGARNIRLEHGESLPMSFSIDSWYPWARNGTAEAAQALIASGLTRREASFDDAVWRIMHALRSGVPQPLTWMPEPGGWDHELNPSELARAWIEAVSRIRDATAQGTRRIRTVTLRAGRLSAYHREAFAADWHVSIENAFRRHGIADQVVLHAPSRGDARWSWPVRIGVLSSGGNIGGFGDLLRHWWRGKLFHLADAGSGSERFDILIIDGESDPAVTSAGRADGRATAVILVGPQTAPLPQKIRLLDDLRRGCKASVAVTAPVEQALRTQWLYHVIEELAHALPLHEALHVAAESTGLVRPLVLGDRHVLPWLDVLTGAERLIAHAEGAELSDEHRVRLTRGTSADLRLGQDASAPEVVSALRGNMENLPFLRESGGAATIGAAVGALERVERYSARRAAVGDWHAWLHGDVPLPNAQSTRLRLLRARLCEGDVPLAEGVELSPDTFYTLEVSLGPPTPEWLAPDSPFVEPDGEEDSSGGWRLRIVAWEPTLMPQPAERAILLPKTGASNIASFSLRTGAVLRPFGARVTVLHGSRVLQTGVLLIGVDGATFRIDSAPESVLSSINTDKWASASIVLNNDISGQPTATTVNGRRLGVVALPEGAFDDFTKRVSQALGQIAQRPEEFTSLESEATRQLLVTLAQSGGRLFESLVEGTELDKDELDAVTCLQIVSTKALTFFPAEFVYGFDIPSRDAKLCPGARTALHDDRCCTAIHSSEYVCPMGFWSLSKVIERYAHAKPNVNIPGPFTLYGNADVLDAHFLDPFRQVLYAACNVADKVDTDATRMVEEAASAVARGSERVHDWSGWRSAVARSRPSLLLLLPHHVGEGILRIGEDSELEFVSREFVSVSDPPDSPLVLLLGCETLPTKGAFNNLVQRFLWRGATAVVATYGTILGRHASPAAVKLLTEVDRGLREGSVRLGTVLRSLKRTLLLEGQPMVLGLTTHGDADLLLQRNDA
jgi:hypothetical protein